MKKKPGTSAKKSLNKSAKKVVKNETINAFYSQDDIKKYGWGIVGTASVPDDLLGTRLVMYTETSSNWRSYDFVWSGKKSDFKIHTPPSKQIPSATTKERDHSQKGFRG